MLPPGDITVVLLNWRLKLSAGHSGHFMPLNEQAKKEVPVLAGLTDPDYQW